MGANEVLASGLLHPVPRWLFNLVFRALEGGECLSFPCDADGRVDLDALGEPDKVNYLWARTLVGRRFHRAVVEPHALR